jgi:pimeloyl-ACP methyl ester carboxylesterase
MCINRDARTPWFECLAPPHPAPCTRPRAHARPPLAPKNPACARPPCPFRRYVIDTREELSAFDSVLLEQQARFALACLRYLASAYALGPAAAANATAGAAAAPGPGVLLFGHSMGGVVARLLLLEAEARRGEAPGPGSVSLLVTLASPQAASPLMLHPAMGRLYARLAAAPLPAGVPVVSISGGARDVQASWGASGRGLPAFGPCIWARRGGAARPSGSTPPCRLKKPRLAAPSPRRTQTRWCCRRSLSPLPPPLQHRCRLRHRRRRSPTPRRPSPA